MRYKLCRLLVIGQHCRALNVEGNVPFHLYLGFHSTDFPQSTHITLSTYTLHMI
jgi:hypothetical protein